MHTLTFYSYKGGTGRSLVVANVAKYLAMIRQKVFVLDFDLEAPGLHYKFSLDEGMSPDRVSKGLVDIVLDYQLHKTLPESLDDYIVHVSPAPEAVIGKPIILMPAGSAPKVEYWLNIAKINWHDLLYNEETRGVEAFIELKEKVRTQYEPDFLLIDARTGITEMGGIATTTLADTVICLMLDNAESLEGSKALLRAMAQTPSPSKPDGAGTEVLAAISRVTAESSAEVEALRERVRGFLSIGLDSGPEVLILHQDKHLASREELLFTSLEATDASRLLVKDYYELLLRIIPKDELGSVVAAVDEIVQSLGSNLLSSPDVDQPLRALELLATSTRHPRALSMLLNVYRLQRRHPEAVEVSRILLQVKPSATDLGHIGKVVAAALEDRTMLQEWKDEDLAFFEQVWVLVENMPTETGTRLAGYYRRVGEEERARRVLELAYERSPGDANVVIALIHALTRVGSSAEAWRIALERSGEFAQVMGFQEAWANAAAETGEETAQTYLEHPDALPLIVAEQDLMTYARLHSVARRPDVAMNLLARELELQLTQPRMTQELKALRAVFGELSQTDEFEAAVEERFGRGMARRLVESASHALPRSRRPLRGWRDIRGV